jgi:hypothetical protein
VRATKKEVETPIPSCGVSEMTTNVYALKSNVKIDVEKKKSVTSVTLVLGCRESKLRRVFSLA